MSPYRTVCESITAALEEAIAEMERERLGRRKASTPANLSIAAQVQHAHDKLALGLLRHGDQLYVERDPAYRETLVTVRCSQTKHEATDTVRDELAECAINPLMVYAGAIENADNAVGRLKGKVTF